jgi:hypothetical protein
VRGRKLKRLINKRVLEHSILNCNSMSESSRYLDLSYNTFKKYCKRYGLWTEENINQSGKGLSKSRTVKTIEE